jgi:hypothetical protein
LVASMARLRMVSIHFVECPMPNHQSATCGCDLHNTSEVSDPFSESIQL